MDQQRSDAARREKATPAKKDKPARQAWSEAFRTAPKFYRPRFTVKTPEGDVKVVPGYN